MRHFIGGWALGYVIGLWGVPMGDNKPIQCTVVGTLIGLAAWGLLP